MLPGYWAFGNSVGSLVLSSLTDPSWAVMLAWAFAIVQLVGTTQVRLLMMWPVGPPHLVFEDL